jgi:hypothetical protein
MSFQKMKQDIYQEILEIINNNPIKKEKVVVGDLLMINSKLRSNSKKYPNKKLFDFLYLFFNTGTFVPGQQEKLFKKIGYKNKIEFYKVLSINEKINSVKFHKGLFSIFYSIGFFEFYHEKRRILLEKTF